MATIKDVAKYAGVSHGTVSNVLNGLDTVSLDNVKKVEEAIKALGYKPNLSARNLKSNKLQEIAIIFPNITESIYATLFTTFDIMLENQGYKTHLYLSNDIIEKENAILDTINEAQMAGVIMITCQPTNTKLFSKLIDSKTKYVFLEREPLGIDCNYVGFDNKKSVVSAMKYLHEIGCRFPALITGTHEFSSEQLAFEGYNLGIAKYGFDLIPSHIRSTTGTREDGFCAAVDLINDEQNIDSIICTNTQLLEGVIRAVHLSCSEDTPFLIALGDDSWNKDSKEHTKILPRPYFQLAENTISLLMSNIENPAFFEYQQLIFESEWNHSQLYQDCANVNSTLNIAMVDGEMANALHRLLPDLKKKTGIELKINAIPYDELYETICDDKRRKQYDVFSVDSLWFREFQQKGYLANLTKYIDDTFLDTVKIKDELFESFGKINNQYFAIPYHYSNQLLFYRKDLFENIINKRMFFEQYGTELRCPKTWMEYNAVARFFTQKFNPDSPTEYGTTLGGDSAFAAAYDYLPRFWSYGANLFDRQGNLTIDSKNALKALENYCESYQYASKQSSFNWLYGQVDEFISGKAAMMILDSSYASKISNPHYSRVCGKVGFDSLPGNNSVHWIWSYAINESSDKKDAAIAFIRWICDEELAMPTTLLGNISASSIICTNGEIFTRYPWIIKSLNAQPISLLDYFTSSQMELSPHHFISLLANAIHNCVVDKVPVSKILDDLNSEIRKL